MMSGGGGGPLEGLAEVLSFADSGLALFSGFIGIFIGLAICFFGLRIYLFLVWLAGAVGGGLLGAAIGAATADGSPESAALLWGILGAIIGGGLSLSLFWFSVWFMGFLITFAAMAVMTGWMSGDASFTMGCSAILGIIGGFIFIKFYVWAFRVVSAILGALGVANSLVLMLSAMFGQPVSVLSIMLGKESSGGFAAFAVLLTIAITIVLSYIGIRIQFGLGVGIPSLDKLAQSHAEATGAAGPKRKPPEKKELPSGQNENETDNVQEIANIFKRHGMEKG
jgi:hypothetical protein